MSLWKVAIALSAGLLASHALLAAAPHAHVHGVATLQIAIEGSSINMSFSSPLENLLGFEHAPRTDREKAAASALTARLRKAETLFVPTPAAGCALDSVDIIAPRLQSATGAPHAQGDRSASDSSAQGRAKPHAHPSGPTAAGEHADLDAVMVFGCRNPDALRGLEVRLFEPFKKLRQLDVQTVGPKGQSATRLSPSQRTVTW